MKLPSEISDLLIVFALAIFMIFNPDLDITSTIVGGFLGFIARDHIPKGGSNGST